MSAPQPGDKSAGFSGLILGAIVLFVVLFGISLRRQLTNDIRDTLGMWTLPSRGA